MLNLKTGREYIKLSRLILLPIADKDVDMKCT
jgi:hypothetical protein